MSGFVALDITSLCAWWWLLSLNAFITACRIDPQAPALRAQLAALNLPAHGNKDKLIEMLVALDQPSCPLVMSTQSAPPSSSATGLVDSDSDDALQKAGLNDAPAASATDHSGEGGIDAPIGSAVIITPSSVEAGEAHFVDAAIPLSPSISVGIGATVSDTAKPHSATVSSSRTAPAQLRKVMVTGNLTAQTNPRMWLVAIVCVCVRVCVCVCVCAWLLFGCCPFDVGPCIVHLVCLDDVQLTMRMRIIELY